MSNVFAVPADVAHVTHEHLRAKGREHAEGVVLWIGTFEPPTITRAVVPDQETSAGRFRVPLAARQKLTRELAGTGQVVVAQVHSHPSLAFHSSIDDAEAIPRRVGAYSLVVPDFGRRGHLLDGAALFQLASAGRWVPAPPATFDLPQTVAPAAPAAAATRRGLWRRLTDTLKSFGRSRI